MRFKLVRGNTRTWVWPYNDNKLLCIFQHVEDIDRILEHVEGRQVVVQAGGATGVFPERLAQDFERVITFEPNAESYASMCENITSENVMAFNAAVSDRRANFALQANPGQADNYGAWWIKEGDGPAAMLIDDLELDACDLLMLDIEGAELDALKGARKTIEQFKPVVVVEDKACPQLHYFRRAMGDMGRWLEQFGYTFRERIRWDNIYSC